MFGNLEPCHEMVDAVVKCVKQSKHNGYAPSTGTHSPGLRLLKAYFDVLL